MYAISAENHGAGIVKVPLVNNELDLNGIKNVIADTNNNVKVVFFHQATLQVTYCHSSK